MTKREFYERLRGEDRVWPSELASFILDYDLYDFMEIRDDSEFSDWVWDQINNWDSGWESLSSWLSDLPQYSDYYISREGDRWEYLDSDEIPDLIDSLEEYCERWEDEWYDDVPDEDLVNKTSVSDEELSVLFS